MVGGSSPPVGDSFFLPSILSGREGGVVFRYEQDVFFFLTNKTPLLRTNTGLVKEIHNRLVLIGDGKMTEIHLRRVEEEDEVVGERVEEQRHIPIASHLLLNPTREWNHTHKRQQRLVQREEKECPDEEDSLEDQIHAPAAREQERYCLHAVHTSTQITQTESRVPLLVLLRLGHVSDVLLVGELQLHRGIQNHGHQIVVHIHQHARRRLIEEPVDRDLVRGVETLHQQSPLQLHLQLLPVPIPQQRKSCLRHRRNRRLLRSLTHLLVLSLHQAVALLPLVRPVPRAAETVHGGDERREEQRVVLDGRLVAGEGSG